MRLSPSPGLHEKHLGNTEEFSTLEKHLANHARQKSTRASCVQKMSLTVHVRIRSKSHAFEIKCVEDAREQECTRGRNQTTHARDETRTELNARAREQG